MTLQQFINKWNGKPADYDKAFGPQCVDIVQYWSINCGYKPFWGNAVDIYGQQPENYTWHRNLPWNKPEPGDVIVWGRSVGGGYGHCAIAINATLTSFTSFDQNWPTGTVCHVQSHNLWSYRQVIGWGRPKRLPSGTVVTPPKPPAAVYHTVVRGDTLSSIAAKYRTTVAKLVELNKAKYPSLATNPNFIQIGWILRVK